MEDSLSGRNSNRVTRPVVPGEKVVPVRAPTHPPQDAERDVRESSSKTQHAKWHHAKVKEIINSI